MRKNFWLKHENIPFLMLTEVFKNTVYTLHTDKDNENDIDVLLICCRERVVSNVVRTCSLIPLLVLVEKAIKYY